MSQKMSQCTTYKDLHMMATNYSPMCMIVISNGNEDIGKLQSKLCVLGYAETPVIEFALPNDRD